MPKFAYPSSSPYSVTPQSSSALGVYAAIDIPPDPSDIPFTVVPKYTENPMLLSNDIYGTPALWSVFSRRNIDVLRDPIFDLQPGVVIRIPTLQRLNSLGISI